MTTSDTRTRGQRWADAVTRFGGSWPLCFYLKIDRMKRIGSATKRTAHSLDCYISA